MKTNRLPSAISYAAVILAAAAALWLTFTPDFYRGVSVSSDTQEPALTSATLVDVNGWWVLAPLLLPAALSVGSLLIVKLMDPRRLKSRTAIWTMAAMLFVFCLMGAFSIGTFYLPSALALLAAAVVYSRRPATPPT
jgi:hypothetical protein